MKGLAIILGLTFFCSRGSTEDLNVTLVKQYKRYWCVAQGEAASSALAWTPQSSVSAKETVKWDTEESLLDCNFMKSEKCRRWKTVTPQGNVQNWTPSSVNNLKPPLFDYRWNELPVIYTSGKIEFREENYVPLPDNGNSWEITLSVNADRDAYILLSVSKQPFSSGCYWIILGGWIKDGGKCAIRKCPNGVNKEGYPNGECKESLVEKSVRLVGADKWIHVTVSFTRGAGYDYRSYTDLHVKLAKTSEVILYYRDWNPTIIPKFLNVRSASTAAFFRIHNYSFNWNSNGSELEYNKFAPRSSELCVSLLYYTTSASTHLQLIFYYNNIGNGKWELLQEVKPSQNKWEKVRIVSSLTDAWRNGITLRIKGYNTNGGDVYFAIGGIRECALQGDKRISAVMTNSEQQTLSCHLIEHNETFSFKAASLHFTEDTPNCKTFTSDVTHCNGAVMCQSKNNGYGCFCSPGFRGDECANSCEQQKYGKNCGETCGRCYANEDCNKETGMCVKGCEEKYRTPYCNTSEPVLKKPPVCVSTGLSTINIEVKYFDFEGEGDPKKIILQYKKNEQDDWIVEKSSDYKSVLYHQINNLISGTEYSIRVVLFNSEGEGYQGNDVPFVQCRTHCNHPQSSTVTVNSGQQNVTINWQKPTHHCQIHSYNLIVERNGGEVAGSPKVISALPFTFENLDPYTDYKWKLYFTDGKENVAEGDIRTKEDLPTEVLSLNVTEVSSTTLYVSWKTPEKPNGIIRHYFVTYKHVRYRACSAPVPISNTTSVGNFTTENNGTSTQITSLVPYSRYTVTVKAFTVGYGKNASDSGTTKELDVPQIHLLWHNDSYVNKDFAMVWWTLPQDCTSIKSDIKNFEIKLIPTSRWGNRSNTSINISDGTHRPIYSARLEKLIPYTNYSVSVYAKGSNGNINLELPLNYSFTTSPDVPGPVLNATAFSFGPTWINLRWIAPYPPHGKLAKYQVEFWKEHYSSRITKESDVTRCSLWEEFSCVKIGNNLESNKKYHIEIRSKNIEPDVYSMDKVTLTATTTEKAPGPPLNLKKSNVTSTNVTVTWEHPFQPNGKVKYFEVEANETETYLRKRGMTNPVKTRVNVGEPRRIYSVQLDLLPATVYNMSVRAVTNQPGEYIIDIIKVPVSAPDIRSFQLDTHTEVTNTSFGITIPKADQYLTNTSFYLIIVTPSKTEDDSSEERGPIISETLTETITEEAGIKGKKWWIAAKLQPDDEQRTFKVGNNSNIKPSDKTYWNRPLTPGENYQVTLVAVNQLDESLEYSINNVHQQTKSEYRVSEPGGNAAWAALLLLLIIPAVVYLFIWRKKHMKKEGDTLELKTEDALCRNQSESTENITQPELEPDEMPVGPKLPPSQRFSRRVAISDLEKYVKEGLTSGELQRQHALFPRGQTQPWDYGRLPQNKSKNRYGNLVAYDETRVKLKKLPEDQFSDYINANYINGYNSPKFYIATQGPKRNTIVDFWRMVWQEHVQVIAMLTNIVENGKLKCEQYWPQLGQEVTYGSVTVLNASNKIFADFTFRMLNVTCKGKTRKVHHLHFTSWPDHGVPLYPQSVASYLKKLLATPPGSGPIVVHCSAGVGRTGTIILADVCLRMAAAEGFVDILGFLQQIREQRANMVDNLDQYKLVHLVLLECLVAEPSAIPCDCNLEKRIDELRTSGALVRQFNHLHNLRWQDQALKSSTAQSSTPSAEKFKSKNRSQKIVPGASGRTFISRYPYDDMNSDYINAVLVDGFRIKDQFIATQFPLPSTVADFWRLIVEKNVSLVVVLNEVDLEIKNVCKFWPTKGEPNMNPMPYLALRCRQEDDSMYKIIYRITILDRDASSTTEDKTVQILQLKGWKSDETLPPSTSVVLELWQETERLYNGKGPIVVTCLDGAKACGYFLSLAFLVEKIKLEQECDVCHAIRTIRQNREQFVSSYEQFEFLYKAAVTYLDTFQTYANFN
ncbi:receptor-type tyrosine-protein phosphatase S-like isoform X2 [Periplaneta americana]|uniref:receptor-type tyrosine-protein phosphatase S-like isoform X2 n=1 Tax=Periplaneta americana TaxID=6978 RepID=UPI0037E93769